MTRPRLLAILLAIASAVVLAACGGDDDPGRVDVVLLVDRSEPRFVDVTAGARISVTVDRPDSGLPEWRHVETEGDAVVASSGGSAENGWIFTATRTGEATLRFERGTWPALDAVARIDVRVLAP